MGNPRDDDDPVLGQVLGGCYRVSELIGAGGIGRVYRGEHVPLGKTVAIKVIRPGGLGDESTVQRFYAEARAASRLNHPHCVAVIDFGKTESGLTYLVMEFLRGRDLARMQVAEGLLPFRRIADICRQVCRALAEAHAHGVLHLDIKPANIVVEPMRVGGDFVKVVDFGLAKVTAGESARGHLPGGTPEYVSPEQAGGGTLDGRSDLYSLGVVLYELLTGRVPFHGEVLAEILLRHLNEVPVPPRERAPERDVPRGLEAIAMRALAKAPGDRYGTAEEMAAAIEEWMELSGHSSSPPSAEGTRRSEPPPAPVRALPDTMPGVGLIGREVPIKGFSVLRERATSEGVAVRIVGERGVGKRSLATEVLETARADGDLTLSTSPGAVWGGAAYAAARELLVGLLGLPRAAGIDAVQAEGRRRGFGPEALAGLVETFTVEGADALGPDARRRAAGAALRSAVESAASARRVLLVIEDLDACDGLSRGVFAHLASPPMARRLLLVGLHGPGFDPGWAGAGVIELSGLPRSEAELLLERRIGRATPLPAGAAAGDEVLPLYVEQLARFVMERGVSPPDTLGDLVAARLGLVPDDARVLARAAAVLGAPVDREQLATLVGDEMSPEGAEAGIADLVSRELLRTDREELWFTHPVLAEIAHASIPAARRKQLHARALDLCRRRGAGIAVLAHHARHTEDPTSAIQLLEEAGDEAARRGDRKGAVTAYRRGVEVARWALSQSQVRRLFDLTAKLGWAMLADGDARRAKAVLEETAELAFGASALQVELRSALSAVEAELGETVAAVAHAKQAAEAAVGLVSAESSAALQIRLGRILLRAQDPAGAALALAGALAALETIAEPSEPEKELLVEALCALAESNARRSDHKRARSVAQEALGVAERSTRRSLRARCLVQLGRAIAAAGDPEGAIRCFEQARALYELLGDREAAQAALVEAATTR